MVTENGTVILIDSFNLEGKITLKIKAKYNVERITLKVSERKGDNVYVFNEAVVDKHFERVFYICPHCSANCRVPARGKKVEITCPKCGRKFMVFC